LLANLRDGTLALGFYPSRRAEVIIQHSPIPDNIG
jgi:hypothetical protein